MPGSPYVENPEGILTWRFVLIWIISIPILGIGTGFVVFKSIGAIIGGVFSILLLWILSRRYSHK